MSDRLAALDLAYTMIWREDRLEDVIQTVDDDFEWITHGLPDEPIRRGPDEVRAFFQDWMDRFEGLDVDWELEEADARRVIAYVRMHGRGRGSGVPAEMRYAQVFTYDGDRPVRMELYLDPAEGRRAVGLE